MSTDAALLRKFLDDRSESAFAELVHRYVDLVHSAALRQVGGDTHQAQDVTQEVFTELARKAPKLVHHRCLAGWLYNTARFIASRLQRSEMRRTTRETVACLMKENPDVISDEMIWTEIRPVLDAAMAELPDRDREAVVLRYFQSKPLAEIGSVLCLSENSARMRVERALEKLRLRLNRRGIRSSALLIATALAANAVSTAPSSLAAAVLGPALAGAAAASTTSVVMVHSLMSATNLKAVAIAAALVLLTTTLVEQRRVNRLAAKNKALLAQIARTEALPNKNPPQRQTSTDIDELDRKERLELMRLRGQVAVYKRDADTAASLQRALDELRKSEADPSATKLPIYNPYLARSDWADQGTDSPSHALETMLWAASSGDTQRLAEVIIPASNSVLLAEHPPIRTVKGVQIVSIDGHPNGVTRIGAIVEDKFYGGGLERPPGTVQDVRFWYLIQTNGEWRVTRQAVRW
jgi:RNA polymerase sigma factor (sigma-70 family)